MRIGDKTRADELGSNAYRRYVFIELKKLALFFVSRNFAEQELDRVDRAHRIENAPQHIHLLEDVGRNQQFFLARAGARDVDRREHPLVGDLAVENDFANCRCP